MTGHSDTFDWSRRAVLGTGVAGAAALITGAAQAQSPPAGLTLPTLPTNAVGRPEPVLALKPPLPETEKIGVAVVGLGKLALGEVLPALGQSRACKLAALVSGSPDKAKATAARMGLSDDAIYDYAGFGRIADDPRIQLVYILLPNALHADYTVRALKAGKHVLCEKPMATSTIECEDMIKAAADAQRKLMIAYRCHYEPHNLAAMRAIRQGEIGRPSLVVTDNGRPTDLADPADQWRLDKKLSGGGALFDIGIYGINAARYLLNEEPVEVRAWSFTRRDDPRFAETEDVVAWQFRFASGAIANGSTSFSYAETSRLQVIGDKGRVVLDPATNYRGLKLTIAGQDGERQPQIGAINQFARELDHFADAIRGDAEVISTGEEGLQDVRLMQAVLDSARSGVPVKTNWSYRRQFDPAQAVKVTSG